MSISDLIVKESEVGEAAVEKLLKPYVQLVDNGEISFNGAFFDLKADEKIAVALIAKSSWRFVKGKESYAGGMKNEELEKVTALPGNTVRPKIKELRDKLLIRTDSGIHSPTAKLTITYSKKLSDTQ